MPDGMIVVYSPSNSSRAFFGNYCRKDNTCNIGHQNKNKIKLFRILLQ